MTLQIDVATMPDSFINLRELPMSVERLPFTVKVVANDEQLYKAVGVRHSAYARHLPEFAKQLTEPEASDLDCGSLVLVAESKLDGTAVGTMRIQTNCYAPLKLEESVCLPDWLQGCTLAEATRLGVTDGREGRLVKSALFKAYFLYCQQALIDWMVITARKPLDRQYDALLFKDALDGEQYVPMRHVGNMPHRVMAFDVATAEARWNAARHPLYAFIFRTTHPDIQLSRELVAKPFTPVLHGRLHSQNTMAVQF